jgi:hypothetical protein
MSDKSMKAGIDAVINIIDRSVAVSEKYKDTRLREYYNRDMAAIRAILLEMNTHSLRIVEIVSAWEPEEEK